MILFLFLYFVESSPSVVVHGWWSPAESSKTKTIDAYKLENRIELFNRLLKGLDSNYNSPRRLDSTTTAAPVLLAPNEMQVLEVFYNATMGSEWLWKDVGTYGSKWDFKMSGNSSSYVYNPCVDLWQSALDALLHGFAAWGCHSYHATVWT